MQPDDSPYMPYNAGSGSPDRSSRSLRRRGTNPALPGVTMPTVPNASIVPATPSSSTSRSLVAASVSSPGAEQPRHRQRAARRAAWKLLTLGAFFALVSLCFYPLLASAHPDTARPVLAILTAPGGLFPWIPRLYWTAWLPAARAVSHLPMFDVNQPGGSANLLLLGLAITTGLYLLAARVAHNVGRERLLKGDTRLLFWIICGLAALYGLLFLFAPAVATQDVLRYSLYGRMVTFYHVNPYSASFTIPPGDPLRGLLVGKVGQATFGPVWMDVSLTVALAAQNSIKAMLLDFRLLALVVHLVNALLIWHVLTRLKPEARFTGVLLYAWNPVVLLLGISEMHLDLLVIFFILLATLFFQRSALVLSWVCLLLSALIQPLSLLLFPLFIRLFWKATRGQSSGRRAIWWVGVIGMSAVIVGLAYAPYYAGWGLGGIASQLRQALAPDSAINSLDAAIQHLRFGSLPALSWLVSPLSWTILAALVAGSLLLLGAWLTETLEYALLFASWVMLAVLIIAPSYLAWYALLPLALAICSANQRTTLLALLLAAGALLSYYFNLFTPPWSGQGLVTIGLPVVIWGWLLFFTSTWRMTRVSAGVSSQSSGQLRAVKPSRGPRFSRPPWLSRP